MTMEYPAGATPLDPDEADGLKLAHITTRGEVDYFEAANIRKAEQWAFGRKHKDLMTPEFIRRLHKQMFGDVWKWAGNYRTTEKNIGVLVWNIGPELRQLCDNVRYQIEHSSYEPDELVARFHHQLVKIHPFPNGNGRISRIMADLVLVSLGQPRFSWGQGNLDKDTDARKNYLDALRAADKNDYSLLMDFVWS
jgi:Fic-DOC domain mobile mystery protein B